MNRYEVIQSRTPPTKLWKLHYPAIHTARHSPHCNWVPPGHFPCHTARLQKLSLGGRGLSQHTDLPRVLIQRTNAVYSQCQLTMVTVTITIKALLQITWLQIWYKLLLQPSF